MSLPILCLDFDGVIHSYTSGWKGPRVIPDPPVPGALKFIVDAQKVAEVHIFSSRSNYWFGRWAMRRWLYREFCKAAATYETTPAWLMSEIHAFADPWPDQVDWDMGRIVSALKFPRHKPPAVATIDDRAFRFDGVWGEPEDYLSAKPWYRTRSAQ